jgi:hypothetical protein
VIERDPHTGRFIKPDDEAPFNSGRTVNEATWQLSHDTLTALNRACARAEQDLLNAMGGKQ